MKDSNPIVFAGEDSQSTVVFAAGQLAGDRENQEDFVGHFRDECFVIADGVGGMPHGEVAATLAGETAIWGYRHIRLRPTYWLDKRNFMRRIFRSTNMAVWQKRKEPEFGGGLKVPSTFDELSVNGVEGLATTLIVCIVGPMNMWVGSVGDSSAYLYREGLIASLTREDVDERGFLTNVIGTKRLGLASQFASEPFLVGDIAVLCTDGVSHFAGEEELRTILADSGETKQSLSDSVERILEAARQNGSTDNMTVCIVKRISPPSVSGSHPPYLV